ncbi:MAG: phosphatidylglycerol lysyltransferase domain-containing protein [Muribaculaceae bacterium]|nr:phosphatidylglycerol lysyltransferase domain-containing protein [Muribaculaceae bacterium]
MKTTQNTLTPVLTGLEFTPVTDDDCELLRDFFEKYPSRSCDFSVGGVLLWNGFYQYEYSIVDDSLLIMGSWPGSDLKIFYEPRGPISIDAYTNLVKDYCRATKAKGIILLPEETLPVADGDGRPVDTTLMPDWMEYVYEIEKFNNFPGKKMAKKRNHLNFFKNHYDHYEIEEISESIADELIDFTERFSEGHADDAVAVYEAEEIKKALRNYSRYPYYGIAIRVDGNIVAYTFGEAIGDTMIIHAEKGDISYGGVYQAISSFFAEAVSERYPEVRYLNREDDMGSEDLRKSKLSYHPSFFIGKRVISL